MSGSRAAGQAVAAPKVFRSRAQTKEGVKKAVIYSITMKSERILQPDKIHFQSYPKRGDFGYKFTASAYLGKGSGTEGSLLWPLKLELTCPGRLSHQAVPQSGIHTTLRLNMVQIQGNLALQQLKMENWSVEQVCNWLKQRNLGELVPKFREEEVSGAALLALNDRMVQQLVKKIGHQAVLMDLIRKYQQEKRGLDSLTHCSESAFQKFPEVISGATDRQMLNSVGHLEQKKYLCSTENEKGQIDYRVLKQKKNLKSFFARYKMVQWSSSYSLPDFPYDVKCILAEKKCPDHSMRIRIIEFLQADMTKYLEGSLYPNSQQYNIVVSALLQAYPFLDEDGNGFFLWKRALKDRFKYVRRPIEDDEQVLRNKCKFGHRRGQTRKSSFAENKLDDVQVQVEEEPAYLEDSAVDLHIKWLKQEYMKTQRNWKEVDNRMNVTIEIRRKMISNKAPLKDILRLFPFLRCPYQVKAVTPVLEVKNPFNVNSCEFALYIEREELAQLDDCTMALAALVAAFHVFNIPCPKRIHRTLKFLESLVFEVPVTYTIWKGHREFLKT
ncbi:sterile alpha motif domain-containing protein 3 isoform X2 [Willisornis vidua]|uniref:Sterile alpha motif domain-containing protein 3 isoform X2 n=1 Tax=Willisornis vidua TaxID=1566151 RepID=A0ABQ9CXL9_9PASS|nr:sterile alpha motif domain-containing protein 3 isoform X2 [Willisornis vidua]